MAEKLTKAFVDSLALTTDGTQLTIMDTVTPGFGVRVGGASKTFIVVKRTPHGTPKRVTLGKYGALTVDTARKLAIDALARLSGGTDVNAEKKALKKEKQAQEQQAVLLQESDKQTLGWLFEEYKVKHLVKEKGGSEGSLQSMQDCVKMFDKRQCQTLVQDQKTKAWRESKTIDLNSWLDRPLRSITTQEVLARFEVMEITRPQKLIGGKLSPMVRTHQVGYKFAQSAFEWFIPRNYETSGKIELLDNPFKILRVFSKWKPVGVKTRIIDFTDAEEFGRWWIALQKYRTRVPVAADYIEFSLLQGGRSIEIINMTWDMVDFKKRRVVYAKTKNKEDYVIPLSNRAFDILNRRKEQNPSGSDWVWNYPASKTGHIPKDSKHHFHEIEALGAKYVTTHDLKRTWATAAHSVPEFKERDINYLLKHKSGDVNKHYFMRNEKVLLGILQKVEDIFVEKASAYAAEVSVSAAKAQEEVNI